MSRRKLTPEQKLQKAQQEAAMWLELERIRKVPRKLGQVRREQQRKRQTDG